MTNNISNAIKMVKMLFVRWQQQLHDRLPFSVTSDTPIFSDWVKGLDDHWGILWATGTRAGWVLCGNQYINKELAAEPQLPCVFL